MLLTPDETAYRAVREWLYEEAQTIPTALADSAGRITAGSVSAYLTTECSTPDEEAQEWADRFVTDLVDDPIFDE